jgi:hypothetical protein
MNDLKEGFRNNVRRMLYDGLLNKEELERILTNHIIRYEIARIERNRH